MPKPKVEIQAMYRANQNIDVTVAAEDLHIGATVLTCNHEQASLTHAHIIIIMTCMLRRLRTST